MKSMIWYRWLKVAMTFFITFLIVELLDIKFWVATEIYRLQGLQWSLRNHVITTQWLHEGVRYLNALVVVGLIIVTVFKVFKPNESHDGRRYILLLASVLLSFGMINYLKILFGMDCPWDLQIYGGEKPYFNLWTMNSSQFSSGRCFPAGHSSIGFAWIALYFFWRKKKPLQAQIAFALAIVIGILLGLTQQLRGAHFFVDDMTTAFICWSISLFVFQMGEPHETTAN